MDECSTGLASCFPGSSCENTIGSFRSLFIYLLLLHISLLIFPLPSLPRCACLSGYREVSGRCQDIDECKNRMVCGTDSECQVSTLLSSILRTPLSSLLHPQNYPVLHTPSSELACPTHTILRAPLYFILHPQTSPVVLPQSYNNVCPISSITLLSSIPRTTMFSVFHP